MGQSETSGDTRTIQQQEILIMKIFFVLLFFVSSSFSVPRFYLQQEQAENCYKAFYRCCSSTESLPLRCFELNNCPIHFNNLHTYNRICNKMYADFSQDNII